MKYMFEFRSWHAPFKVKINRVFDGFGVYCTISCTRLSVVLPKGVGTSVLTIRIIAP